MAEDIAPSERKREYVSTPHALVERDAAQYVGFSPHALRAWRRQGRGPAYVRVQHARNIRYRVEDLDAWLHGARVETRDTRTPKEAV